MRSWFVYVVKLPEGCDREAVIAALERDGIATSRYLPSIHLQAYMRERYGFAEGLCPVSEETSRRTLALPFFPQLEREDQERVVDVAARRARLAVDPNAHDPGGARPVRRRHRACEESRSRGDTSVRDHASTLSRGQAPGPVSKRTARETQG